MGHRLVHGGLAYRRPHLVTPRLMAALEGLISLAPQHLPHEIKAIAAVSRRLPGLRQVACFDTAFHRDMPTPARTYPLPRDLTDRGVIRFGFHGLSYEYIVGALAQEAGPEAAAGRVIIAHLGNGASMVAVSGGRSLDTTMGLTPAGGIMMGTRPGDLDLGVVLHLMHEEELQPSAVADLVNRRSGLLGVSGLSSDMRSLLEVEAESPTASEAVTLFCYRARSSLGALATVLGGLEGYLLTGRHGIFPCYEAFIPIVDSMLNQYAKWLKVSNETPWREPLASLNYLLTSHVWRQDHNGYTHQVPSFINNITNKKGSVARIYLPPDANCLLSVTDHCLRSRDYVNLIVASKQMITQWLDMDAAREHCAQGASVWQWAGNDGGDPDVILAAAGDVPTEETLAAADLLRREVPELRVRVVNVVDLFTLMPYRDHPHGLDDETFVSLFTEDRPVIFAFHGYPRLIHELVHHRPNTTRFHVRGYMEEGRTTTPFDMLVLNQMSRYQLAIAALQRVSRLRSRAGDVIDRCEERLAAHRRYIEEHDEDLPEVRNWRWGGA